MSESTPSNLLCQYFENEIRLDKYHYDWEGKTKQNRKYKEYQKKKKIEKKINTILRNKYTYDESH